MDNQPQRDEDAVCGECGRHGAFQIGDRYLCLDCYHEAGSGCAGGCDNN